MRNIRITGQAIKSSKIKSIRSTPFIAYPQCMNGINRDQMNAKCLNVEIPMLVMPSKQIKPLACAKRVSELLKAKVAVRAQNARYARSCHV